MTSVRRSGLAALLVAASGAAHATENAQTHIDLAFFDQLAGVPLPPGFYAREDVEYTFSNQLNDQNGNKTLVNAGLLGHHALKFNQTVVANVATLAYVPGITIPFINATVAIGAYFPYAWARAEGQYSILGETVGSGETRRGFGDATIVPLSFQWAIPRSNMFVTLSPFEFTAPTGQYNHNDPIGLNIGDNYWSYRPAFEYTYLNNSGQEADINYNMSFNSQNGATKYKSGDELSFTYVFQQHFSRAFAAGAEGYFYDQIMNDTQNGIVVNTVRSPNPFVPFDPLNQGAGNKGQAFAIGPVVVYQPKTWLALNVHYEHEVFTYDRAQSEIVWFRGTFTF